jgi:hypothetical protein
MSKLILKNAKHDRYSVGPDHGFCPVCSGWREHGYGCPFNNGHNFRIEDAVLLNQYMMSGGHPVNCGRVAVGLPTPGRQLILGANGHLRITPVSSLRCVRDKPDGRSPMMCAQLDEDGNLLGYSAVMEMLEYNTNHY